MPGKLLILLYTLLISTMAVCQNQDSSNSRPLTFIGFADVYFAYNMNQPGSHRQPDIIYSHNRHNEINLNNAVIGIQYNKENLRSAISFHTGTYVQANYASEPSSLRHIYEAYVGYSPCKKVWLDAGIFSSHIGFESALSINNPTLSRSMMAENTPYYETGLKLTYTPNERLSFCGLILNGWQNIAENNNNKAIGSQVQYKPAGNILFNSSTFIGKETPGYDTVSSMRYFHNFYNQMEFGRFSITAAFDIGFQNKRNEKGSYLWYNPNLILRTKTGDKTAVSLRMEYYHDKLGIRINYNIAGGFQTIAPSLGFDYCPMENFMWRLEGKVFQSKNKIFTKDNTPTSTEGLILTSMAVKF
ncbi:MAG: porin [Cytophagaceae bacterium]